MYKEVVRMEKEGYTILQAIENGKTIGWLVGDQNGIALSDTLYRTTADAISWANVNIKKVGRR